MQSTAKRLNHSVKFLRSIVAALAVVAVSSGCSDLFGPKPNDAKPFAKKSNSACVKDVPDNVKAWLSDGKTDIGLSVDCAVAAIDDFSRHVAGKTKNVYSELELKEFISEYLVAADSSDAGDVGQKTDQILKLKQVILGGASDLLTKDELTRLKSMLLRAKPLLVGVTPNIQTLLFSSSSASADQVTSASENLTQLLELLAQEFERTETGRPEIGFTDLLQTAKSLGLKNESIESIAGWILLAESIKVLVLNGDADVLRAREWAPMIRTIGQMWGLALRAKYNLSNNPEKVGRDFPVLEATVRQSLDLLDRSVKAHNGSIPLDVFEKLIDVLDSKHMLPSLNGHDLKPQTLKNLLPTFFGKLFYGRWNTDYARQSLQFGVAQLATVRALADDWIAGQTLINSAFGLKNNGDKTVGISQFSESLASGPIVRKNFADELTFTMAQRAQKQLLLFMSKGRPSIHDDQGRLIVVPRNELPAMPKADLDLMNLTRVVLEGVLAGWTQDPLNAQGLVGLTESETQDVYLDLRMLGHDLNFIDVRSMAAGTRTFMENAIFMSSSDGNAYMGLQESIEWFSFVSSGGKIADRMYHDLAQTCGTTKIDVLGNQKLEPKCFRREFLRSWTQYMPNLPGLIHWTQQDGSGTRAASILAGLESAGRSRGASDVDLVDSSEFRSMMSIVHYMESMFARHDVNKNDVLDQDEIWGAFPLLAPFIKKMGNGSADGEAMQKTILSYILEFGQVPSTTYFGLIKLGGWYVVHGLFTDSADRAKVLGVIGAFPASNKAKRVASIATYYDSIKSNLRPLLIAKEKATVAVITDLLQCLPEAAPLLSNDMALKVDALAPVGANIGSDVFVTRMKSLIDSDPRLEPFCLPF